MYFSKPFAVNKGQISFHKYIFVWANQRESLFKIYLDFNHTGFNYSICVVKKREIIPMKVLSLLSTWRTAISLLKNYKINKGKLILVVKNYFYHIVICGYNWKLLITRISITKSISIWICFIILKKQCLNGNFVNLIKVL